MAVRLISLGLGAILVLVGSVDPQEVVTGPVKIYDTIYHKVDPCPPFTEAPRTAED